MEPKKNPPSFINGKTYDTYFTTKDKKIFGVFFKTQVQTRHGQILNDIIRKKAKLSL